MPENYGYARVSTTDQDLSLQLNALEAAGCPRSRIFKDTTSGACKDRPGLKACLRALVAGDMLIVWRLDRLGRSLPHLISTVEGLKERGILFKSLCEGELDTSTANGELIFNIFSTLAQFERRLVQERTRAGLQAARARGKFGGRPPLTLDDPRVNMAQTLHANKKLKVAMICKQLNVSKSTFYRLLNMPS